MRRSLLVIYNKDMQAIKYMLDCGATRESITRFNGEVIDIGLFEEEQYWVLVKTLRMSNAQELVCNNM